MNWKHGQSPGGRRSVLIVNELGYEVRLCKWRLKLYRDEQFLMEVGMEFHVAGELWLKANYVKNVNREYEPEKL